MGMNMNIDKIKILKSNLEKLDNFGIREKSPSYDDVLPISDKLYNKIISYYPFFHLKSKEIIYDGDYRNISYVIAIYCLKDDYYYVDISIEIEYSKDVKVTTYSRKIDQFGELIKFLKILFKNVI